MKLNLSHIINPQIDGAHKITGHLRDGAEVIVERHLNMWDAQLKITVE